MGYLSFNFISNLTELCQYRRECNKMNSVFEICAGNKFRCPLVWESFTNNFVIFLHGQFKSLVHWLFTIISNYIISNYAPEENLVLSDHVISSLILMESFWHNREEKLMTIVILLFKRMSLNIIKFKIKSF